MSDDEMADYFANKPQRQKQPFSLKKWRYKADKALKEFDFEKAAKVCRSLKLKTHVYRDGGKLGIPDVDDLKRFAKELLYGVIDDHLREGGIRGSSSGYFEAFLTPYCEAWNGDVGYVEISFVPVKSDY